ncbi:MAG TPA: hypothetical protein DDX98_01040 [Bacteroidales bacterium]|mgnify:CR=1 FL=1|jgi:uncharacterized membrane protein|nr:hypothetical protein [Bacteroidales bacterium]
MKKHLTSSTQHQAITKAEKFWYGWLKGAAIIVTLFGVILSVYTVISGSSITVLNEHIANTFKLSDEFMIDIQDLQAWMIAIIGSVTAGWGITLLYMIIVPLKRKEKWAWNAIMISMLVWFSIDTFISSYYGARFNVVINIAFALQFVAPLLFLRTTMLNENKDV